ncbi:MAG: SDR family oxidoreductase [Alphaproteobacteria bacterium]|nr:SDR family oxidoreductase [Alphaproteobacteria bacterium]
MQQLFRVDGKVALVTGGTSGIGKMIATALLQAGAKVYVTSRKAAACDATASELAQFGPCVPLPADISRLEEIRRVADHLGKTESALDILVNNAGTTWGAPIESFPEAGWDKVMDLNLKSVFFLTQALLPLLKKRAAAQSPSSVVNIGSIDGLHVSAVFDAVSYAVSKSGLHQMTRVLASRLVKDNIRVNAIAPGAFTSKMLAPMLDRMEEDILATIPMRRVGEQDDIGGAAVFLCSRAGAYVTGVVLPVDGGVTGCG